MTLKYICLLGKKTFSPFHPPLCRAGVLHPKPVHGTLKVIMPHPLKLYAELCSCILWGRVYNFDQIFKKTQQKVQNHQTQVNKSLRLVFKVCLDMSLQTNLPWLPTSYSLIKLYCNIWNAPNFFFVPAFQSLEYPSLGFSIWQASIHLPRPNPRHFLQPGCHPYSKQNLLLLL